MRGELGEEAPRGRAQSPGRGLSGSGPRPEGVWPLECESGAGDALP